MTEQPFKRKHIEQHKEVLQDGLFKHKIIKKNKKVILEREEEKELIEELKEVE